MHLRRTRRVLAATAIVLVTAGTITACAGEQEAEPGPDPAAGSDSAFPITVDHAFGETVVPAEPTRIVVAGYTEQDTLLALGVAPVGVTEWYGEQPYATWPWAQDALGDAQPEVLSTSNGFEQEKIAALEPDLIIAISAGLTADTYRQLSDIAPTLAQAEGSPAYFERWDLQAERIGTALGKRAEVDTLIADVRQRFAEAATEHPELAGSSAVFLQNAFYDGAAIAYQDGLSTDFLTELGLTVPSEIDRFAPDGETGGQANIPLENLSVLDSADVLLWATEDEADRTELESEPVYENLRAVREGNLVFTDGVTAGAIYFTSLLSLPYVIERLAPALSEALAGTPTTITR